MLFPLSLRRWSKAPRPSPRRKPAAPRRGLVPRLEALEDRALPSTFTVLNFADSGAGSLRQAVLNANANPGADLIRFAPAARDGTITLTTGQLSITDDLSIDGPGDHRLTVSGNNASRVFRISGSTTDVEIRDLTIANGRASDTVAVGPEGPVTAGGGILNRGGRLTLSHMTFSNNQADGLAPGFLALGGAVGNLFGGSLTVTHSRFTGNRASGNFHGSGGAIVNEAGSTLAVDHSTFTGNQATAAIGRTNPATPGLEGSASGGAIDNLGGSQATVAHSTFTDNLVRGGNGTTGVNGGAGEGGALHTNAESALVAPVVSTLTVTHSSFHGNQALGGNGGAGTSSINAGNGRGALGGAITNVSSILTVEHSSFTDNLALGGLGGTGGPGRNGGAGGNALGGAIDVTIFDSDFFRPVVNVSHATFQGNRATAGAGGTGGTGGNGGAGGNGVGGGLRNTEGTLELHHSVLVDNEATGGAGGTGGTGGNGGAGGIGRAGAVTHTVIIPTIVPLSNVSHVTVSDNRATGGRGGNGGVGGNGGNGGNGEGGGIRVTFGTLDVRHSLLLANQATGGAGGDRGAGGARGGNGGNGQGGGLHNAFAVTALLSDTALVGNHAQGGAGGLGGNGGNGQGGGIFNGGSTPFGAPDLTLLRSTVVDNQADGGAAGAGGSAGLGQGGGVYVAPGGIACADLVTVIRLNRASTSDDDIFGTLSTC